MAINMEVHQSHCCAQHGCKYGDEHCPVVLLKVEQSYPCESCVPTKELKREIKHLKQEITWSKKLEARGLKINGGLW